MLTKTSKCTIIIYVVPYLLVYSNSSTIKGIILYITI